VLVLLLLGPLAAPRRLHPGAREGHACTNASLQFQEQSDDPTTQRPNDTEQGAPGVDPDSIFNQKLGPWTKRYRSTWGTISAPGRQIPDSNRSWHGNRRRRGYECHPRERLSDRYPRPRPRHLGQRPPVLVGLRRRLHVTRGSVTEKFLTDRGGGGCLPVDEIASSS